MLKQTDMTIYAKPIDILTRLKSVNNKNFIVEVINSTFSVAFRKSFFSSFSPVHLDVTIHEIDDKRSRINIQATSTKYPRHFIVSIIIAYLISPFFVGLKFMPAAIILEPLILLYVHHVNVDDQRRRLLIFLNSQFEDIRETSCI
jgi:hypothetical protein